MGEVLGIGEYATRALREEGIEYAFVVTGIHAEMFYAMFPEYGMKAFNGRHEQWGPYACDGYAGASRKMAVCAGTAGPGATNMVSGIAQAYQNYRPMLALCGMHGPQVEGHWSLQEAQPIEIMRSVSKFAQKLESPDTVGYWIRRACSIAREYPPGPVVLAMSPAVMGWPKDADEYLFTWPRNEVAYPTRSSGDPQTVEKAVEMILNAERPFMFTGDGLYWAHGEEELREFVELTQTPVCGRRASRGSVPEDSALGVPPGSRGAVQQACDLCVLVGMRDSTTEMHYLGAPLGAWSHDMPFIQINEAACDLIEFLPTPLAILGNPKNVLKQMTEYARELLKVKKPDREKWLGFVAECKRERTEAWAAGAKKSWKNPLITGPAWKQVCREFIEDHPETTMVLDSFSGSHWSSGGYVCRSPGQSLDTGGWGGIGHGIAMGFGIQVARPGKPVMVMVGDGGMGIGGMEIETCARYKMPVVSVVWNNSEWMAPLHDWSYKCLGADNRMQKDIKYDRMFGVLEDVYSETCTQAEEIRPALERAFDSGKTAVVNLMVDPVQACNPGVHSMPAQYARWFGLERAREVMPPDWFDLMDEEWKEAGGVTACVEAFTQYLRYVGV